LTALANCNERRTLPAVHANRFRDSHHNVARLFAFGYSLDEIAELSGYSYNRVRTLGQDPAFQELVAQKREVIDQRVKEHSDEYGRLLAGNMIMSERQIRDRLEQADEDGDTLPIRDLISIGRDAADRLGRGKTSVQFNVNSDFATLLDRAVKESTKVIEGTTNPQPATRPPAQHSGDPVVPSPLKRRV